MALSVVPNFQVMNAPDIYHPDVTAAASSAANTFLGIAGLKQQKAISDQLMQLRQRQQEDAEAEMLAQPGYRRSGSGSVVFDPELFKIQAVERAKMAGTAAAEQSRAMIPVEQERSTAQAKTDFGIKVGEQAMTGAPGFTINPPSPTQSAAGDAAARSMGVSPVEAPFIINTPQAGNVGIDTETLRRLGQTSMALGFAGKEAEVNKAAAESEKAQAEALKLRNEAAMGGASPEAVQKLIQSMPSAGLDPQNYFQTDQSGNRYFDYFRANQDYGKAIGPEDAKKRAKEAAPSENQAKASTMLEQMRLAEQAIEELASKKYSGTGWIAAGEHALPRVLKPEEAKKFEDAKDKWVSAYIAQIYPRGLNDRAQENSMKAQYKQQFFPLPSDTPDIVKQKAEARKAAMGGFEEMAGPAVKEKKATGETKKTRVVAGVTYEEVSPGRWAPVK